MRPIRLEIEGLQSFAEKQIIDFKSLTEHGLFGIFGKTGSGKSTILDAITLAIYGDIVRIGSSKDDKLINLLNVNSDKIEVTYTFSLNNTEYTINRKFPKKKKELEFGSKKVFMYCGDEIIADKDRDIKSKVEELIGLNMEDFTRSVVLPQGKFSEFLKLTGKDKRNMLERIFNLEKYGNELARKINFEKASQKKEIDAIENQIVGKGNITQEEIDIKKEELLKFNTENIAFKETSLAFKTEYEEKKKIKDLIEEFNKYTKIKEILKSEEKNIENLKLKIENSKDSSEIEKTHLEQKDLKDEIKREKESLSKSQKKSEILKDKIKKLETEISNLKLKEEENIKKAQSLEVDPKERELLNEIINLEVKLVEKKETLSKDTSSFADTVSKITTLQKEEIEIKNKLADCKSQLDSILSIPTIDTTTLLIENGKLETEIEEVKKLEEKLEKIKLQFETEEKRYKELEEEIEKIKILIKVEEEKEKNNLAYMLAKDLEDTDPCPVCGSHNHPKLATPSVDIDKEILEKLKVELEKLYSEFHKLDLKRLEDELSSNKTQLNNRNSIELKNIYDKKTIEVDKLILDNKEKEKEQKSLENLKNKLEKEVLGITKDIENQKEIKIKLDDSIKELSTEIKELENSINEKINQGNIEQQPLENLQNQYKKLQEQEKNQKIILLEVEKYRKNLEKKNIEKLEIEKELTQVNLEITSFETTLKLKQEEVDKLAKTLDNLIENSKFVNLEEALSSLISSDEEKEFNEKIKIHHENTIGNEKLLDNVTSKLDGRSITIEEWETLQKKKVELEEKEKFLAEKISLLDKDIKNIEKTLSEITELQKEKQIKEHRYHLLEDLANLFKGNAFVEYLAIGKLKNITIHASKRLEKITNGRYGIEVGEDGSFLIRDNFNGGVKRRAATLSGGETFLVSLSLALALSNQIQLKGKTNLEFFFLDEGFGTLDTSLLDRVISSLETLKEDEKLKVGIITHVEELKERVPRRLEVLEAIPGERGSKVILN